MEMYMMKHYPLPKKYHYRKNQNSGTFLECRKDRVHCGVDLYAPRKTPVYAVDDGIIQQVSQFTSPTQNPYWNVTYQILLYDTSTYYYRYAELDTVLVSQNETVSSGQQIGLVGQVLNPQNVKETHPEYIKKLIEENKLSMLHFEVYSCLPESSKYYLGGNWFAKDKPKGIIDPTVLLDNL
jgi:murein DD-endopeptidase MepM/ murein hydrolase activator NlpD